MSLTSGHSGSLEQQKPTRASPVQPEPWDSTDKHKVMWLVQATIVLAAITCRGKRASDKGNKGNTGRGNMGHEGSQGARVARAVAAPNAHQNLLRLPSLCGSLARCMSP